MTEEWIIVDTKVLIAQNSEYKSIVQATKKHDDNTGEDDQCLF